MSIKLGIYDFLAYTIPGGLYLLAILYIVIRLTPLSIDLWQITIIQFFVFTAAAYVLGLIIDPIAKNLWYRRFETKNLLTEVLKELNTRNEIIDFPTITAIDWYILLVYIRRHNMEMAVEIERFNAVQIMLRNVSFALLLYAILPIIDLVEYGFSFWQGLIVVSCFVASMVSLKQSIKFDKWFYLGIYETIAGLQLKPEFLPVTINKIQLRTTPQKNEEDPENTE